MPFAKLHAEIRPHCLVKAELLAQAHSDPSAPLLASNPFAAASSHISPAPTRRRVTLAVADSKLRPARSADSVLRSRIADEERRQSLKDTSPARELDGRQRSLSLHNPFRELDPGVDQDV